MSVTTSQIVLAKSASSRSLMANDNDTNSKNNNYSIATTVGRIEGGGRKGGKENEKRKGKKKQNTQILNLACVDNNVQDEMEGKRGLDVDTCDLFLLFVFFHSVKVHATSDQTYRDLECLRRLLMQGICNYTFTTSNQHATHYLKFLP